MPRFLITVTVIGAFPALASAAGPVCALLDPDKTPRVALLEAKLLADPSATWVERVAIDKVLAEQKLQALLSPQGVGERVKLGKLLKADLLVSVRPVRALKDDGTPDHVLEVTASETATGLRLLVRAVPVTDGADADVAALLSAVRDGIKRHGEKITEVVAVPPFVSQDLGHQGNYLKTAYARVLEAAALARPGVLVVELAEAEALAKEVALTAPGAALVRPPAVYLLGEYRHAGVGKERAVTLKLRAERGGMPVGEAVTKAVKPDEASGVLRAWVSDVLKAAGPAGPADPKAEAKLLVGRARELRRLGFRADALDLLEAALLLDTAEPELCLEALVTTRLLLKQRNWTWLSPRGKRFEDGLQLYRRGLVHLEAFVVKGGRPAGATPREKTLSEVRIVGAMLDHLGYTDRYTYRRSLVPPADSAPAALEKFRANRAEMLKPFEAVQAEQREMLFRIIPLVTKWERTEHGANFIGGSYMPARLYAETNLLEAAVFCLPIQERFAVVAKFVLQLKDVTDVEQRVHGYLAAQWHGTNRHALFDEFLARLDAAGDEKVRAAVKLTREYMPRWHKYTAEQKAAAVPNPAARPTASAPPPRDPKLVTFTPVALEFPPADEPGPARPPAVTALIPVGPGVDVLAAGPAVFVMKEKGKPRRVWAGEERDRPKLVFDGRFVWVSVPQANRGRRLFVLDPAAEKVHAVTEEHDLPEAGGAGPLVALGPGRVCLAGSVFDRESVRRAWVAVATFDPVAGPAVKVIHEAKIAPDPRDDDWKSADVAFAPETLVTYRRWLPGEKPELRVILPREVKRAVGTVANMTPLLIDPERGTVVVLPKDFGTRAWVPADAPVAPDGSLYEVARGSVWRVTPDGRRTELAAGVLAPPATASHRTVFLHDGRLQIIDLRPSWAKNVNNTPKPGQYEWWEFDPATNAVRFLAGPIPAAPAFAVSAHYGPVLVGRYESGTTGEKLRPTDPSNVYAVAITPPAKTAPRSSLPSEAVAFKPVTPMVTPPGGGPRQRALFHTVLAAGPGVDVLGGGGRVYVMKEKGIARQVWAEDGSHTLLTFDGRFVWVAVERGEKEPGLFVLDPATEKVHPVTAEHKLPRYTPGKSAEKPGQPPILVAPIGPGRVCVAGSLAGNGKGQYGYGDCWMGVATFDPTAGPAVTVKLTSGMNQPSRLDPMTRRTADGKEELWFRLARDHSGTHGREWVGSCVFFDPERTAFRLLSSSKAPDWTPTDAVTGPDGARYEFEEVKTYSMKFEGYPSRATLYSEHAAPLTRVAADKRAEVKGLPQYDRFYSNRATLYHGGRVLISDGYYWNGRRTAHDPLGAAHWRFGLWEFDPATEEVRQLAFDAPPTARLAVSSHYGVVAVVGGPLGKYDTLGNTVPRMYAIDKPDPVAEK